MGASAREDLGSKIIQLDANASVVAGAPGVFTAGGTGDATKVTGQTIDRYQGGGLAQSAAIATSWFASLTNTKTLSFAHEVQYSDDGSTWDTAVVLQAATVVKTAGSSANFRGIHSPAGLQLSLRSQKRYLRVNVTPDINTANTDIGTYSTQVALGGFDVLPQ